MVGTHHEGAAYPDKLLPQIRRDQRIWYAVDDLLFILDYLLKLLLALGKELVLLTTLNL